MTSNPTTTDAPTLPPVISTVEVPLAPARAFALFTDGIATWWPLDTHACDTDTAVTCFIEPRLGGRLVERADDGTESPWGTVLAWEPPGRLAFTWHPARDPSTAQEVQVTFAATDNGTLVTVTHTGWEVLGERAEQARQAYETGWALVLGQRFGSRAGATT